MAAPPPDAWFYADGRGGSVGPYPRDSFASIAASGALPPATPVFCASVNGGAWQPLAKAAADLGVTLKPAAPATATAAAAPAGGPPSPPPSEREFVDDDGTHFVWDGGVRRFVPKPGGGGGAGVPTYGQDDMTFPAATAPPRRPPPAKPSAADVVAKHAAASKRARDAAAKEGQWDADRAARAAAVSVYVSGLPPDATKAEVAAVFAKCGVLKPAPDGSGPRVKLYTDEAGQLKGDGVVTFLKPPSVDLALTLLDGARFRAHDGAHILTVSRAEFTAKQEGAKKGGRGGGDDAPPLSKKARRAMAAAVDRALGWDGDDGAVDDPVEVRTVVLRGAFDDAAVAGPSERAALERALAALAADAAGGAVAVRARAHAGGVAVLRFGSGEGAARAVSRLSARAWRGRELDADLWDGVEKFGALGGGGKKGKQEAGPGEEADDEARLAAFAAELEAKGGAVVE